MPLMGCDQRQDFFAFSMPPSKADEARNIDAIAAARAAYRRRAAMCCRMAARRVFTVQAPTAAGNCANCAAANAQPNRDLTLR
jgi:hypothetical protein